MGQFGAPDQFGVWVVAPSGGSDIVGCGLERSNAYAADRAVRSWRVDAAEALALDSSSLFCMRNGLRNRGYLHWLADPADGRAKLISLKDEGRAIARQVRVRSVEVESEILDGHLAEEITLFRDFLEDILPGLKQDKL